jgi:hypothetical protein
VAYFPQENISKYDKYKLVDDDFFFFWWLRHSN